MAVHVRGLWMYRCRFLGSPHKIPALLSSVVKLSLQEISLLAPYVASHGENSWKLQLTIGDVAGKEAARFPLRWSPAWQVVLCSLAAGNDVHVENGCCCASLVPEK